MKSQIIAVANQKGGVAKTTSVLNLGVALSLLGKRVLLIDGDPQGSLTEGYLKHTVGEDEKTIAELMLAVIEKKPISISSFIYHNDLNNIDYIPADIRFSALETTLVNTRCRESVLKRALQVKEIEQRYDFVVIDCPPSLSLTLYNILTAADQLIIPVSPEKLSVQGIQLLLDTVADVKEYTNEHLKVQGFLTTRTTATKIHRRAIEYLSMSFENLKIIGNISNSIAAAESIEAGKALGLYRECPTYAYFNKMADEYSSVAKYITLVSP